MDVSDTTQDGFGKFEAKAHALEQAAAAQTASGGLTAELAGLVRAHPVAALLAGSALGYAIGWMLDRR